MVQEQGNNREKRGDNIRRFLSFFLVIAAVSAAIQFFLVMREPQKWLLVSATWMGALGFQRLMHLAIGMAPALWVALWALSGLELDTILVRSVTTRNRVSEKLSFAALWLFFFIGGPLAVSRIFPARFPTSFLTEHPFAVAFPAAACALISHAAIIVALRRLRGDSSLSFAVSVSSAATCLLLVIVNIYILPDFLSPVSLIGTGVLFAAGAGTFRLLSVMNTSGLDGFLAGLSDSFLRKPLRPALVLIVILLATVASALPSAISADEPETDLPNVVLITVDTLRADHLTGYGYFLDTSPELDRLASEGTMFTQCISTAPQTVPAIASLMTSKYPSFHSAGTTNGLHAMVPEEPTLARTLQRNGYYCAAFVSNYVLSRKLRLFGGFDVYDDTFTSMEFARPAPERTATKTTEYALNWLEVNADRRFLLWVHYQDPHGPYTPPATHEKLFLETAYVDARVMQSTGNDIDRSQIPDYQYIEGQLSPQFYISRYDAEIAYADESIGRLLRRIKALGLWEKSIIIFTADHGESMGEHGHYFQHGQDLTEELIRAPLLIRVPMSEHVGRVDELVSTVDIAPTVLDILRLQGDLGDAGLSLVPLIRGERKEFSREYVVAEDDAGGLCLRSRGLKYIAGSGGERMYDLAQDPAESKNLLDEEPGLAVPWRERRDSYRDGSGPVSRKALRYSREEAEKLKTLGYVR